MFSEVLKERTGAQHAALEKNFIKQIKMIRSTHDYVKLLWILHGYYAAVEHDLKPHLEQPHHLQDYTRRRKTQSLLNDLNFFSASRSVNLCKEVPHVNSYPAALGAMYVLEGSTLGGQIIAGIIAKQLGIEPTDGFSFFTSYGVEVKQMWESYKQILHGPFNEDEKNEILETAIQTFTTFKQWIDQHAKD